MTPSGMTKASRLARRGSRWSSAATVCRSIDVVMLCQSILQDRAAQNFAGVQVVAGLVDLLQRVTPRDQSVQREFSLRIPAQVHRKVLVREARAEAAAVQPLAVHEQRGVDGDLLLWDADQDRGAAEIVGADAAGPRRAQDLLDGDLLADR